MAELAPLTLGTAGHIDHGKTALIAALTGRDTDRLPQERARGISIELGYAPLTLASGRRLSVVDVPGHERFVRTMVAGATGIDLYLMVVAADDGIMPQTREHAAVLRALGVDVGVVAVTKSDLADPAAARDQAAALLPGAECVALSARTGAGLDELRDALECAADGLASRADDNSPTRLHIDRVFSIAGAGTVITGTLWSGTVARGDEVRVLGGGDARPLRARVRAVHIHDEPVARAQAGQRVALNVVGPKRGELARGDVVVADGAPAAVSYRLDAALEWADAGREPAGGERVQVHHGTRESPARLAWLGGRYWQVRLEHPLVAWVGDRVVLRRIAAPDTLGGGIVLDPAAARHGPSRALTARLTRLERGEPAQEAPAAASAPTPALATRAEPALPAEPSFSPSALALETRLRNAGLEPPSDADLAADPADLAALRAGGRIVRVSRTLHFHVDALSAARERILALAAANAGAVTLADLRDELRTSRKFAQALLEHFDAARLTRREGDAHVLRRR